MDLSVVIPVHNEAPNIRPLCEELTHDLDGLGSYEVICVDDGSTDETFEQLRAVASADPCVKVIRLRRNFGQTPALAAGIHHATGEIVVLMDGDGQNDPADIGTLVAYIEKGFDVVSGWRHPRRDPLLSRRIPSIVANRVISWVTGVRLRDYGCTLKAYRREVISSIQLYGEMHRFLPVFAARVGASIHEVEVNHRPRTAGRSKYGISRTFKVLLDLLTVKFLFGYATKPIYVFGGAGLLSALASVAAFALALYEKVASGVYVHRNPVFIIAVFLGVLATQFLLMGLIAELAVRTYHESQDKPVYVIRETVNL